MALAIGASQHIIFDQFTNPIKPLGYFLTYRAMKKFKTEDIITIPLPRLRLAGARRDSVPRAIPRRKGPRAQAHAVPQEKPTC
jgi:hypothetical protein